MSQNEQIQNSEDMEIEANAVSKEEFDELNKRRIDYLNRLVQELVQNPEPERKPMLRMKHISHLDLDGYGATILSELLQKVYPEGAMTLETKNILPNRLVEEVRETLEHIEDYDMIVITDLAINQQVINLIRGSDHRDMFFVFDHHITDVDEILPHMTITEKSPMHKGKLTCATELYFNFIRNDRVYGLIHDSNIRKAITYFVECVRIYDTFEFWPTRNDPENQIDMAYYDAPRLNTLFHILERDEFKEYVMNYILAGEQWERLTVNTKRYPWVSKILELENNKNEKYVQAAIRRLVKVPFKYRVYRDGQIHYLDHLCGVVFAEKSSPVIGNYACELNSDIEFCAVVSNNQVSLYTNRENIDVSRIAKIFGGGGHKEAAGLTIPYVNASVYNMEHFRKIINCAGMISPGDSPFEDQDVSDTN